MIKHKIKYSNIKYKLIDLGHNDWELVIGNALVFKIMQVDIADVKGKFHVTSIPVAEKLNVSERKYGFGDLECAKTFCLKRTAKWVNKNFKYE